MRDRDAPARHIEHQMAFLADATARRSEKILKLTETHLRQLAGHTSARCDLKALAFMRERSRSPRATGKSPSCRR